MNKNAKGGGTREKKTRKNICNRKKMKEDLYEKEINAIKIIESKLA